MAKTCGNCRYTEIDVLKLPCLKCSVEEEGYTAWEEAKSDGSINMEEELEKVSRDYDEYVSEDRVLIMQGGV